MEYIVKRKHFVILAIIFLLAVAGTINEKIEQQSEPDVETTEASLAAPPVEEKLPKVVEDESTSSPSRIPCWIPT